MHEAATRGWVTATELADTLVRAHGVPFTAAHAITADLIRRSDSEELGDLSALLREVSREHGYSIDAASSDIARWLSPDHFVAIRSADGEPAPEAMARALGRSRAHLVEDRAAIQRFRTHEQEAEVELKSAWAAV
jgi:argininosuccinate lyase